MSNIKPFLKWVGGKTQILTEIEKLLPTDFNTRYSYVEPFLGAGAMLFNVLCKYTNVKNIIANDINDQLINTYNTIKYNPINLSIKLERLKYDFNLIKHLKEDSARFYKSKRAVFNTRVLDQCDQAALFIFLNKTCFNGMYRVNSKNEFNTSQGFVDKQSFPDQTHLLAVSNAIKDVLFFNINFENVLTYVTHKSLFYIDPPYKPLSKTSNFTTFTKDGFDDSDQIRLKEFCDHLHKDGHKFILSNSDDTCNNGESGFFDKLYSSYNIRRVEAKRNINGNISKRGKISELLIFN